MSWLGELYPDSAYDTHWRVPRYEYSDTLPVPSPPYPAPKGNLPAGTASSEFRRAARGTINVNLPFGTVLRPADRNTNREGCTSLFNIGTSASTFHHQGRDNTFGNLTAAGQEVSADFHFPLPGSARVSRPFGLSLSGDGTVGDEFGFTTDFRRYSSSILKTYYTHSGGATGSALVELRPPTGSRSAYVLVNGIDRTTESGSAFVARYGLLTLMHGFLSAGDPSAARSIAMRPRIEITSPTAVTELTDPPEITITWRTQWLRWDGSPYVNGFAYSVAPPESDVEYVLLYSRDNGRTWLNVIDDSVATPGEWPASSGLRVSDQNDPGDEAYVWTTPSGLLPEGSYLLRVEAYRVGASLHYSYHQEKVYVNR